MTAAGWRRARAARQWLGQGRAGHMCTAVLWQRGGGWGGGSSEPYAARQHAPRWLTNTVLTTDGHKQADRSLLTHWRVYRRQHHTWPPPHLVLYNAHLLLHSIQNWASRVGWGMISHFSTLRSVNACPCFLFFCSVLLMKNPLFLAFPTIQ